MNKSNTEEIIGVLWLILATLFVIAGASQWAVIIASGLGFFSIGCAMYYGYKSSKDKGNEVDQ